MFTKSLLAVTFSAATLFAAAGVQAAPLSYKTQAANVKINCTKIKGEKEPRCHELSVAYPQTGDKTLDAWALATIKQSVGSKDLSAAGLKKFLSKNGDVVETNKSNQALGKDEYPCALDFIRTLELEGQTPQYAVFGHEEWEYTCGAHGNGSHGLFVLKRGDAKAKPLGLKDILLPKQKAKLVALQKEGYIKYLQQSAEYSAQDARAYVDEYNSEGFKGTDNWRFAKGGLVFLFQSYEIGAYALGRPEVFLSNQQLKGIIKPEILREAAQYQVSPEILRQEKEWRDAEAAAKKEQTK
nr:RsiV family protein [uncultured Kingella sp.]